MNDPKDFLGWQEILEEESFPVPVRQTLRREVGAFLARCCLAFVEPTRERARIFVEAEERIGNRHARPSLRWLFGRCLPKLRRARALEEEHPPPFETVPPQRRRGETWSNASRTIPGVNTSGNSTGA